MGVFYWIFVLCSRRKVCTMTMHPVCRLDAHSPTRIYFNNRFITTWNIRSLLIKRFISCFRSCACNFKCNDRIKKMTRNVSFACMSPNRPACLANELTLAKRTMPTYAQYIKAGLHYKRFGHGSCIRTFLRWAPHSRKTKPHICLAIEKHWANLHQSL